MHFDVIILGSGPGGYVASIRAAQLGMKTAIIEKDSLGGVCLNIGCIPTKSILNSAKILQSIKKNKELFNIENIKINYTKIFSKSKNAVNHIKKNLLFLMKKNNIHIIYGYAKLKKNKKIEVFKDKKSIGEYTASHIIIATGSIPRIEKKFYDRKKIITYKEAFSLSSCPNRMIIIGSGSIGLEFAYFYQSIGTKVTIIEISKNIFPSGDNDISNYLKYSFERMGIKIYNCSIIKEINIDNEKVFVSIIINSSIKQIVLETDIVFYAMGVIPNTRFLGLEEVGIQIEKEFIVIDKNYRTNIDGYYAIGDVIKTTSLAHVASHEAINCVENIKGLDCQEIDYNNVPKCVYSYPEIASIGYTEEEAKKKGFKIKIAKFPFKALGRAISDEETNGFIKVIFDAKYDEWLGCHMIGNNVTDLISEVAVARKLETTSYEMLGVIHPHPSLSESILESIAHAYGKAIHF
ncbi:dihydrolipoyl dehydrogenase [Blattabacterium cuenoti]|uniref:dihydrolipoyl dehydrogenase n=1 Tax=Blattabacterium cuenoti TaxID=1653831 RepID=UPI00163C0CA2|nr:dihydrolipoyl dehydrogenase [Blattabacterium cuenoti]